MSDDEDDPFERLGDVDREGDPFERLNDPDESAGQSPASDDGTGERGERSIPEDPFAGLDRDDGPASERREPSSGSGGPQQGAGDAGSAQADSVGGGQVSDPFADLDEPAGDPFSQGDSVFEQVDVGEVDSDDVWDSITDEGEDDEEPVVLDDSRYAEVSKHSYCQQCEYFSEPPDSHCTHESAELIEYIDMERVRVFECPVVAERKELEDE